MQQVVLMLYFFTNYSINSVNYMAAVLMLTFLPARRYYTQAPSLLSSGVHDNRLSRSSKFLFSR